MSECYECKLVAMGKGRPAMCIDCLEKRNVELEAEVSELEAEQKELVYDCRDHRIAKEKALAQLAALREAVDMTILKHRIRKEKAGLVWFDMPSEEMEKLAALLQESGDE